jgi:hypothetical protein
LDRHAARASSLPCWEGTERMPPARCHLGFICQTAKLSNSQAVKQPSCQTAKRDRPRTAGFLKAGITRRRAAQVQSRLLG